MKFYFLLVLSCFLFACSSTQRAYLQNVQLYFDGQVGVSLSDKEITDSKADLVYIRSGERPIATMALAFIENGRYKWLSADEAMLVTENGRIIKSLGFENDVLHVTQLSSDPLKHESLSSLETATWLRNIDSEPDLFGIEENSSFEVVYGVQIEIQGKAFKVDSVIENVQFYSSRHGSGNWENVYWFHSETGSLLRSNQKVTRDADVFEITYVSRALRLAESTK